MIRTNSSLQRQCAGKLLGRYVGGLGFVFAELLRQERRAFWSQATVLGRALGRQSTISSVRVASVTIPVSVAVTIAVIVFTHWDAVDDDAEAGRTDAPQFIASAQAHAASRLFGADDE